MIADETGRDRIIETWLEYDPTPPAPAIVASWRRIASDAEIERTLRLVAFLARLSDFANGDRFLWILKQRHDTPFRVGDERLRKGSDHDEVAS